MVQTGTYINMKYLLSFFLFLGAFSTKAQVVTVGTGSGSVFVDGTGHTYDTIKVNAGTYSGGLLFANVNGTPGHPVVVINVGGKVTGTGGSDAAIDFSTCRYIHITGTGAAGVTYGFFGNGGGTADFDAHYGSSDIEIDHIECGTGTSYAGLVFRTYPSEGCQWSVSGTSTPPSNKSLYLTPVWAIYNMKIHDNYIHDTHGEGMYLGCSHFGNVSANGYDPVNNPLVGAGFPCAGANESPIFGAEIYNNIVTNAGWDGIQLSGCISGANIHDNTITGFGLEGGDGQDGGITWNPGTVGVCDKNTIIFTGSGPCMGIMYQGQGDSYFTNNVIINQGTGTGFAPGIAMLRNSQANTFGSAHQNIHFYGNTIAGGWSDAMVFFGDNGFGTNFFFKNNIIENPSSIYSAGNGSVANIQKNNNTEVNSTAAMGVVSYPSNLHLLSTSVAKGAGVAGLAAIASNYAHDRDGLSRGTPSDNGAFTFTTGGGNVPPTANAGSPQSVTAPTSVSLSGSGSTDPDGTIVSYAWSQLSGPASTITTPATVNTTITGINIAGSYVYQLIVTDNLGATGSATVTITATVFTLPTVTTVASQSIVVNNLSLTASSTAGTNPISSYLWTQLTGPNQGTIASPTSLNTTITGLINGTYTLTLIAIDNAGNRSLPANKTIIVSGVSVQTVKSKKGGHNHMH